ncbi:hypothetical protein J5N97_008047 [Dioscorea zingiberensis]|uniref:non-specific serine/threonine protein kinase n=1 Tax=Dioscorea zingiberensis TaxID=325984 RepID=A0A9D5DD50_9LILI|nr:hypothetical protein J5N97_008047 [Dioscorea zingiberensis]
MAPILHLLLLLPMAAASSPGTFSFDFGSLSIRNLTLLGDSYLRSGSVGLTRDSGVPSSSSGSLLFNLPIPFIDPSSNVSASFFTRFSFSITNPSPGSSGDGLAFFVSPHNRTLCNPGAFLGLFNASSPSTNLSIIAVVFDTRSGANHVGLNIGNPVSIKSSELSVFGIDLKSGNAVTVWIEYLSDEKRLKVWAGYSSSKPEKPVLSASFDLSRYFRELMYVGFSASTEGGTEVHTIESWSFRTFGFPAIDAHKQTFHNVSNGSWSVFPARPVVDAGKSSHKTLALGLGMIGLVSFGAALIVFAFMLLRKRMVSREICGCSKRVTLKGLRQFRYQELSSATKGFHVSRIVGSGAFGTVYRGVDPQTSMTFAVKRSKKTHQSKNEFLAELSIIAALRHKNLVQLQGWCTEKGELLLVYEFMPNGSLDKVLYNRTDSGLSLALDWTQRCSVAIGIASVLTYLHEECDQQVIHRDIKTSNIMLDAHFNARLGDFGLAKLLEHDESPVSTLTAGTMGCVNPICTERPSMRRVLQILNYEAEPMVVPRLKPSLTLTSNAPLVLQEIVLDCYESQVSSQVR